MLLYDSKFECLISSRKKMLKEAKEGKINSNEVMVTF